MRPSKFDYLINLHLKYLVNERLYWTVRFLHQSTPNFAKQTILIRPLASPLAVVSYSSEKIKIMFSEIVNNYSCTSGTLVQIRDESNFKYVTKRMVYFMCIMSFENWNSTIYIALQNVHTFGKKLTRLRNQMKKHTPHGIIRNKHFSPFQIKTKKECATNRIVSTTTP